MLGNRLPPDHARRSSPGRQPGSRGPGPHAGGRSDGVGPLLQLQHEAGNAAGAAILDRMVTRTAVQRDPDDGPTAGGGAAAGAAGSGPIDIIFIIGKPNDGYTAGMTEYAKTTLKGQVHREVGNLEDICAIAGEYAKQGVKFRTVRIVSHGQTNIGGVGMTPAGEGWRFVRPDEIREMAKSPACKALRSSMAKDGQVEFWGCYLGSVQEAGEAWSETFGAPVRSTTGEMRVATEQFSLTRRGKPITSSSKVPTDKTSQKRWRGWLLAQHQRLAKSGEAPPLKTEAEKVAYMTDLFDRSGGTIRHRIVEDKKGRRYEPGSDAEMKLWSTTRPQD